MRSLGSWRMVRGWLCLPTVLPDSTVSCPGAGLMNQARDQHSRLSSKLCQKSRRMSEYRWQSLETETCGGFIAQVRKTMGFNSYLTSMFQGSQEEDSVRSRTAPPGQVTDSQQQQGVTSYLVATSPEVLSQLLRENEARGIDFNPALYTTPANALNTAKVDFAPVVSGPPPPSPYTRHRTRQTSQCSASGPGSAQSTLSRAGSGSPAGSLEKRGHKQTGVRRKASFGASFNSSCQVQLHLQIICFFS